MNNLSVDTTFLNKPIQELPSKFTPKEYRKNIIELEKRATYFGRSLIIRTAAEQSEAVTWFNG